MPEPTSIYGWSVGETNMSMNAWNFILCKITIFVVEIVCRNILWFFLGYQGFKCISFS